MKDTNNILSLFDSYKLDNGEDIAKEVAYNFRKRCIEKNLTRDQVAELAGVAVSNIVRFEQKGLISLKNLIGIAMALGYTSEVRSLFAQQKYSTMEELTPDNKLCAFEYAPSWLVEGFSTHPWNCRCTRACFWQSLPPSTATSVSSRTGCQMGMAAICSISYYRKQGMGFVVHNQSFVYL